MNSHVSIVTREEERTGSHVKLCLQSFVGKKYAGIPGDIHTKVCIGIHTRRVGY